MKRYAVLLSGIALLAAESCAMAAMFGIVARVENMENVDPGLAVWLICLSLCHIGMTVFLRSERSEREIILFCGAFFARRAKLVPYIYYALIRKKMQGPFPISTVKEQKKACRMLSNDFSPSDSVRQM